MKKIGQKLRAILWKIWQFHLNMNIEGRGHQWRHQHQNYFFWDNLQRSFHVWCQNERILNISKFSKWPPFWGSGAFLNPRLDRKLGHTARQAMSSPAFWAFVRRSSFNINGVMAILNLTYFLNLWPNYLTFDLQNLQADVWYQASYVDQV